MLSIENITKKFNNKIIFENISIKFADCGLDIFVSESGSGKTTLFNMITKIDNDYTGNIIYNEEILSLKDVKNNVSYIMQDNNLFEEYTVLDNLKIYDNISMEEINNILLKLNILNKKEQKVSKLSSGEKRKVAIAKSLLKNPSILICDEPTSSLDYESANDIMRILKRLSENMLIICSIHDESLATQYADRIIKIENKQVVLVKDNKENPTKINNLNIIKNTISKKYKLKIFMDSFLSKNKSIINTIIIFTIIFFITIFTYLLSNLDIAYIQANIMKNEHDNTIIKSTPELNICNIYKIDDSRNLRLIDKESDKKSTYYSLPTKSCFYEYENQNYGDIIGNLPVNNNEIMIYQITAEQLLYYYFQNDNTMKIQDLVNKSIIVNNEEFIISGIIKQDLTKFELLKKSQVNASSSIRLEGIYNGMVYPYSEIIITNKGLINELKSKYEVSNINFSRYSIGYTKDYLESYKELKKIEPNFIFKDVLQHNYIFYVNGTHYSYAINNIIFIEYIISNIAKVLFPVLLLISILYLIQHINNYYRNHKISIVTNYISGLENLELFIIHTGVLTSHLMICFMIIIFLIKLIDILLTKILSNKLLFYFNPLCMNQNYYYMIFYVILLYIIIIIIKSILSLKNKDINILRNR